MAVELVVVELEAVELVAAGAAVGGRISFATDTGSTPPKRSAVTPRASASGRKTSRPAGGGGRRASWQHWPPSITG